MTEVKKLAHLLRDLDAYSHSTSFEEQAEFLIANGVTFATDNNDGGKWIPVTERLPEDDFPKESKVKQIKVLVAYMRNGYWVVRTNLRKKGLRYGKPDKWDWSVSDPISHWMPLPPAPKEVK